MGFGGKWSGRTYSLRRKHEQSKLLIYDFGKARVQGHLPIYPSFQVNSNQFLTVFRVIFSLSPSAFPSSGTENSRAIFSLIECAPRVNSSSYGEIAESWSMDCEFASYSGVVIRQAF